VLEGEPPDPARPPSGCEFHPRCPMAQPICRDDDPALREWLPNRVAACHFALEDDTDAESAGQTVAQEASGG
jgi:ABC-type dipeptide/oligopeptide/nickel transport system ATPase component